MNLLILILAVSLVLVLPLLLRDDKRKARRLAAIERKLQLVMDHLGVVEQQPAMPDVVRQLECGKKIQAIKAYRDETGAGLQEAKAAVENMARERGL
jgi:ribosomal protein L7/L12